MSSVYQTAPALVLGKRINRRLPEADQRRQRREVDEVIRRLRTQPGVILADEVGMGKTYVALAVAVSVALRSRSGPVVVMVPANLVDKWEQDLKVFCELYLEGHRAVLRHGAPRKEWARGGAVRYGVARHSVDLMKLLDDPPRGRCHVVFLAQGAMSRQQTDLWIRLALISEALRRHARGRATRLIKVKKQIHRFLGRLLWALGKQRAHGWGEELWEVLLRLDPSAWRSTYNEYVSDERHLLADDPVPKQVIRCLANVNLKPLAEALKHMPIRARGGEARTNERVDGARGALRAIEEELWKEVLAGTRWRSPLLVMDEAHHLKNPTTSLARQLQAPESDADLRTGDGAMARAFDRMLFLTATPFQLGHRELVRILERFGDVRWDTVALGDHERFAERLEALGEKLDQSQRSAIGLQRSWGRLLPDDVTEDIDAWWERLQGAAPDTVNRRQRSVLSAFDAAKRSRESAEGSLRPWIVRHSKGAMWNGTTIERRLRREGGAICGLDPASGIPIPSEQMLPFYLAARSAVRPGQDLLGEALSSSYEAFRLTRRDWKALMDDGPEEPKTAHRGAHAAWYLSEFDRALERCSGAAHPKVGATVQHVVDLWQAGEKVLVFAFYRHTCRALRVHISDEIERRMLKAAAARMSTAGRASNPRDVERQLDRVQRRFFDDRDSPGGRAVDAALEELLGLRGGDLRHAAISDEERGEIIDVMRRFLRVGTTLARCFPLAEFETLEPERSVAETLDYVDASGVSWREKLDGFVGFLCTQCSQDERALYLEAASRMQTGAIRVKREEDEGESSLANVQEATGGTKRDARTRLMRAFNTPFFPDILVCSQVMGEGVDLQRACRHVIHHDLDWNPSRLEQRTGRIDRLGCKAEGKHPIVVAMPYVAGTADERQFRVMTDRERWFRVVMGEDEVASLITPDAEGAVRLPDAVCEALTFDLSLD